MKPVPCLQKRRRVSASLSSARTCTQHAGLHTARRAAAFSAQGCTQGAGLHAARRAAASSAQGCRTRHTGFAAYWSELCAPRRSHCPAARRALPRAAPRRADRRAGRGCGEVRWAVLVREGVEGCEDSEGAGGCRRCNGVQGGAGGADLADARGEDLEVRVDGAVDADVEGPGVEEGVVRPDDDLVVARAGRAPRVVPVGWKVGAVGKSGRLESRGALGSEGAPGRSAWRLLGRRGGPGCAPECVGAPRPFREATPPDGAAAAIRGEGTDFAPAVMTSVSGWRCGCRRRCRGRRSGR